MRPLYGQSERVAEFVASLILACDGRDFGANTGIGIEHEGMLVGGFVFHDYSPQFGVIEVSFAGIGRRWLSRPILYAMFSYVFDELRCQLAVSKTPASLAHAVRIAKAYGFKQVTIPRLFGRDEDGIISMLTVEDWRANGFHKENAHGSL